MSLERSDPIKAAQLRAYVISLYRGCATDDNASDEDIAREFNIAPADHPEWPTDGEWVEEFDYEPADFDYNVPSELGVIEDHDQSPIVRDGDLLFVYARDEFEPSYTKLVRIA